MEEGGDKQRSSASIKRVAQNGKVGPAAEIGISYFCAWKQISTVKSALKIVLPKIPGCCDLSPLK